jgi:hypothetical protein
MTTGQTKGRLERLEWKKMYRTEEGTRRHRYKKSSYGELRLEVVLSQDKSLRLKCPWMIMDWRWITSVLTLNTVNIFNHVTIQECIITCCSVWFLLHYFPHCYRLHSSSTSLFNGKGSNNCDRALSNWMITKWEG